MAQTVVPANNRGLISTFGNYYSRTSTSFNGILNTATLPNQDDNSSMGFFSTGDVLLYINVKSTNATKGTVSITYPFSITSTGTEFIGNDQQVSEQTYGEISFQSNAIYPYTFNGWYDAETGGTLLDTNRFQAIFDGVYTGLWYARWN